MGWVREAVAEDARRCAEVHVSSWRAGYDGIIPDEYLSSLAVEDRLPWWTETLAAPTDTRELRICVVQDATGEICGFGSVQATSDRRVAQLAQLYLDPAAWGTGAADSLVSHLLAVLAEQGVETVTLRVAAGNSRACRFYERGGWVRVDGTDRTEDVWGVAVATVEYRLELDHR